MPFHTCHPAPGQLTMTAVFSNVWRRPKMLVGMGVGLVGALLVPGDHSAVTRGLIGWNIGVYLYLALMAASMFQADHGRTREVAIAHKEGALAVSTILVGAAFASLAAVIFELASTKATGGAHREFSPVLLTMITVAGSWLLIPTLYTLNYASLYHREEHGSGLKFPEQADGAEYFPDYLDFLYFAFTITVAMQTADISITDRRMRRVALVHQIVSFIFNTMILALTINIAAGLF